MDGQIENRTLISKAAIDTNTLGSGGAMNPEQQKQFITFMKDYSVFLNNTGVINMSTTQRYLDSIDVNKRAMRAQAENNDNPATGEALPRRRSLVAKGVILPYDITFQFMKENIEQDKVNETLAKLFAQQFANDTVDLGFNGDETSSDPFLSINDGWIKIARTDADTHKVDTTGSEDYLGVVFPALLDAVPSKYYQMYQREDKSDLKIFCSHTVNRKYKQQLMARGTPLGDSMILEGKHVNYEGFEIIPVGFMPDNVLFCTPYENLAYGIFGASLQTYHQVVVRKTRHEYTLLADVDVEIKNPDSFVFADDMS